MIKPTVGRVVWYYPSATTAEGEQPRAALIAYVHSDSLVTVGGFDHRGMPFAEVSVQLIQGDEAPYGRHARWMPYQMGQAARTEAAEARRGVEGMPTV